MKKFNLLQFVLVVCILCQLLVMVYVAALLAGLVHWHIDRDYYSNIPIPVMGDHVLIKIVRTTSSFVGTTAVKSSPTLFNISNLSFYLLWLQFVGKGILIGMAVREFANVVRSVRKSQTFVVSNTRSFVRIGKQMGFLFILVSFQFSAYKESALLGFYFHTTPLIISVIAFVMSEIFKEGNALLDYSRGKNT